MMRSAMWSTAQNHFNRLLCNIDHVTDLFFSNDKRRGKKHLISRGGVVTTNRAGAGNDSAFAHLSPQLCAEVFSTGEVLLARTIFHKLHGCEQPFASANVANIRMISKCIASSRPDLPVR
jgi:hypothetical protein